MSRLSISVSDCQSCPPHGCLIWRDRAFSLTQIQLRTVKVLTVLSWSDEQRWVSPIWTPIHFLSLIQCHGGAGALPRWFPSEWQGAAWSGCQSTTRTYKQPFIGYLVWEIIQFHFSFLHVSQFRSGKKKPHKESDMVCQCDCGVSRQLRHISICRHQAKRHKIEVWHYELHGELILKVQI